MFSWYMKLLTFVIIVTLASAQNISSFIKRSTGRCQHQIKSGTDQGTMTHRAQRKCTYVTETLSTLAKQILVLNTASLNCSGNTKSVFFQTDSDGNKVENFCNKTECLVYTRRKYSFTDKDVLASIGHPFPACQTYKIMKKPPRTKITVLNGTSFTLEFKLFNLTIPTTASTTTITSRKAVIARVEGSTQVGTTRAMSSPETDVSTTTAGPTHTQTTGKMMNPESTASTAKPSSTQAGTTRAMSSPETDVSTTTAGPTHTQTKEKMLNPESTASTTKPSPTPAQVTGEVPNPTTEHTTMADVASEFTSNQARVLSTFSSKENTSQSTKQEQEYQKKTGSKPWHYALPITLAVILIIICILIFFICKRRKAKNEKGSDVSAAFMAEEKKM